MLTLRARLLTSYLFLLAAALSVITLALLVILAARPEPPRTTYARLSALAQGVNLGQVAITVRTQSGLETLADFSETRGVRVLALLIDDDNRARISYDSAGTLATGSEVRLNLDASYASRGLESTLELNRLRQAHGQFEDDDGRWYFSAVVTGGPFQRLDRLMIMVAEPQQLPTLRQTWQDFRSTLGPPLAQAACVGGLIAFVLAAVITRTITRPLQAMSQAAAYVAAGHLEQSVPVSGPPEVRQMAESFNRMSAEVKLTQQSQRDFLANVSHDLKTPLTSIQGYSQAIIDGTAKDPTHAAEIIHDEASRLNRMVIELTDLARIQAGRLSMRAAAVDLSQITGVVTQRLKLVAQNKGIGLVSDTPRTPEIAGDGDRLVQVIHNLVDNAIKYTPPGGTVRVQTRVNRNGVEVIIADSGPGIPQHDLPRIFERFYQVDKARGPSRGTGLGLAIVNEIVRAHGGQIDVQSAPGQGTTFTVWFPSPQLSTVARGRSG